jgi:hypothetical protein
MEKQFSIRESLKTAWKLIKNENMFLIIGLILGYFVLYGIISTVSVFNKGGMLEFITSLMQVFFSSVFSLGMIKISLQIAKGEEPEFAAFKDVIPLIFRYIGASILKALPIAFTIIVVAIAAFIVGDLANSVKSMETMSQNEVIALLRSREFAGLASTLGLIFLVAILPVIYLSIRWMFFGYLIVDKNSKTIESLRLSWKITEGNFWHLVGFGLSVIGLSILGLLALILGVFVAIPIIIMMQALIYLQLAKKLEDNKQPIEFETIVE